jgi:hypothetical protein
MHPPRRRLTTLLAAFLAVCALRVLAGDGRPERETPCEFDKVERIVAVGDVHGAYQRFLEILRAAAVIDGRNRWIGGRTHLVQTGDVLDRGPDSRQALEFLRRLTGEAEKAGGRVHALLGNHEAMRMLGDFRYVVPGEYAAFADRDSAATKRAAIETAPEEDRARLEKGTPLGMIEMIRAFAPDAELGSYLRTLNTVVRINGIVFLHGGISPRIAPMPCLAINDAVRREVGEDMAKTKAAPRESLTTSGDGPLWYRGLATEPETFAPEVRSILDAQHASAIVVAHTAAAGPIRSRFHNTVFIIDTGMQPAYLPEGRASALEIRGGVFTAIYTDSRQVIAGGVTK